MRAGIRREQGRRDKAGTREAGLVHQNFPRISCRIYLLKLELMKRKNEEHKKKLADAKRVVLEDPTFVSLASVCAEAGFRLTDRVAIENKDAVGEVRDILNHRKRQRELTLPFVLATDPDG